MPNPYRRSGSGNWDWALQRASQNVVLTFLVFDLDVALVDRINRGVPNFDEPGVRAVIATGGKLRAVSAISAVPAHSDIVFMFLPTPSQPDGSFDASTFF